MGLDDYYEGVIDVEEHFRQEQRGIANALTQEQLQEEIDRLESLRNQERPTKSLFELFGDCLSSSMLSDSDQYNLKLIVYQSELARKQREFQYH
jgi:hypothetical protein